MSWTMGTAADVALTGKGAIVSGPFGSNIGSRFFVDEGVPVIRGNNLTTGMERFVDDGFVFLTEEKAAEFKNCEAIADDLIFTAAGRIGQVGIVPSEGKFDRYIISNKQLRLRCDKSKVDPLFAFYWFSSPSMVRHIVGRNSGVSIPLINLSILRKLPIPLPPVDIQWSIAGILSAYDDLIENNRRRIQLLEQSARLLYKEWFVHLRFPGHEHVKVVDGVPKGWERLPLGEVLTLQRGFDLPTQDRVEGHVPIYAATGINGYHKEAKVKGPGIVTGRSGSLGTVKYVLEDFWPLNTTLWVKEFKRVDAPFAYHLLASLRLEQYNGGVAVPTLNRNDVHRIEVVCPAGSIIRDFSAQVSASYDQIDILKRYSEKLREARDLLLPRLMSGEIEV